jgi:hypothetical protein
MFARYFPGVTPTIRLREMGLIAEARSDSSFKDGRFRNLQKLFGALNSLLDNVSVGTDSRTLGKQPSEVVQIRSSNVGKDQER